MIFRSISKFITRLFVDPEVDRLANFIADAWTDLDREVQTIRQNTTAISEPWARSAYESLLRAEKLVSVGETEQAWSVALSAQRAILSNPHNLAKVQRTAVTLRREMDKITGWRVKAMRDLIFDEEGHPISPKTPEDAMRVVDAVALRDDFAQNTWFKILLRRRHLRTLVYMLWSAVVAVLLGSTAHLFGDFLGTAWLIWLVVIFGIIGAAVSVAQSLLLRDITDRIPVQQLGALVVWTRPGIGAATALVVFALLSANQQIHLLNVTEVYPAVVAVFSFIAGYSERFIVGALERITKDASDEKSR